MRLQFALVLVLPSIVFAQPATGDKKATARWVTEQQAPNGGFYLAPAGLNDDAPPKPKLLATNDAVRALKHLGAEVPNKNKHAAFVLSCYDPKTGAFAEPGGKPDVTITSIGVVAAVELGVPREKYAKAMDYLKENAKTFEEVCSVAAVAEAWGVKECPFKLDEWFADVKKRLEKEPLFPPEDFFGKVYPRATALFLAAHLRLGWAPSGAGSAEEFTKPKPPKPKKEGQLFDLDFEFDARFARNLLAVGQLDDGGWAVKGEKASDLESTCRVIQAFVLLKGRPEDVLRGDKLKKLRTFVDSYRNPSGGYALKPNGKSNMSAVYHYAVISKWLDETEAAKK